jgi:hypothetical protein
MSHDDAIKAFFPLVDELETLENLHLWRAVKVHPDLLEFIYASAYRVSIPCVKFKPVMEQIDVRQMANVTTKIKDAFPRLSDLMLRMAKQTIIQEVEDSTCIRKVTRLLNILEGDTNLWIADRSTTRRLLVFLCSDAVTAEARCYQVSTFSRNYTARTGWHVGVRSSSYDHISERQGQGVCFFYLGYEDFFIMAYVYWRDQV